MSHLSRLAQPGNNPADTNGWGGIYDPTLYPDMLSEFVFKGVSFGQMHVCAHHVFHNLLLDLEPHIRGGLRPHEQGCYVDRNIRDGSGRSYHSYGIAIDINTSENPMYVHPKLKKKYVIPKIASKIAKYWGCQWGGDWVDPTDWMHFELHVDPEHARKVKRRTKPRLAVRIRRAFAPKRDHKP